MKGLPIILFSVRDEADKPFLDASSQTDFTALKMRTTPREYSDYFHYYVKKYKNIEVKDLNIISEKANTCSKNQKISTGNFNELNNYFINNWDLTPRQKPINTFNFNENLVNLPYQCDRFKFITHKSNNKHEALENNLNVKVRKAVPINYDKPEFFSNNSYSNFNRLFTQNIFQKEHVNFPNFYFEDRRELYSDKLFKNMNSYFNKTPRYNFKSDSILETVTMSIMVGINTIVDIIACIAIKFCARIPDKEYAYPGTGCILMDYLNEKIDGFLINEEKNNSDCSTNFETNMDIDICSQSDSEKFWIDQKLEDIMNPMNYKDYNHNSSYKYNGFTDALLKNCYKADKSRFDAMEYLESTSYSQQSENHQTHLLEKGFFFEN